MVDKMLWQRLFIFIVVLSLSLSFVSANNQILEDLKDELVVPPLPNEELFTISVSTEKLNKFNISTQALEWLLPSSDLLNLQTIYPPNITNEGCLCVSRAATNDLGDFGVDLVDHLFFCASNETNSVDWILVLTTEENWSPNTVLRMGKKSFYHNISC